MAFVVIHLMTTFSAHPIVTRHSSSSKLYLFGGFGPQDADGGDNDEREESEGTGPAMSFGWFHDLFAFDMGTRPVPPSYLLRWTAYIPAPTETKQWQEIEVQGDIPSPRAAFGMDAVDGSIYLFGGRDTEKRQNDLFVVRMICLFVAHAPSQERG